MKKIIWMILIIMLLSSPGIYATSLWGKEMGDLFTDDIAGDVGGFNNHSGH